MCAEKRSTAGDGESGKKARQQIPRIGQEPPGPGNERLEWLKQTFPEAFSDPDKGQSFRICLDDELKEATVRALALGKDDLFICRDVALTDKLAANLALQCRLKTI